MAEILKQGRPLDLIRLAERIDFRQFFAKRFGGPPSPVFGDLDTRLASNQINRADFLTGNIGLFNQQFEELVAVGPRRKSP